MISSSTAAIAHSTPPAAPLSVTCTFKALALELLQTCPCSALALELLQTCPCSALVLECAQRHPERSEAGVEGSVHQYKPGAIALALIALAACGPSASRPIADPGALTRSTKAGASLKFDGTKSTGSIDKYQWAFGDDTASAEGATVEHIYEKDGDYTATLTVRGAGGFSSASIAVSVGASCAATANITVVTDNPQPAMPVLFTSGGSQGCMGALLNSYEWDFGDGSPLESGATKSSVMHSYATAGTFTVKLKVVDANAAEGRATRSIGIGVMAMGNPTVSCPAMVTGEAMKQLSVSATGTDPMNQVLDYTWSFSDGTTRMGQSVQTTFAAAGSFTSTVVARSSDGRSSTACMTTYTISPKVSYSGSWLLNPTTGAGLAGCPYAVPFPASTLTLTELSPTLTITPAGPAWPSAQSLVGTEDPPPDQGTWRASNTLPAETKPGCGSSTRDDSVRLTFTSATTLTGTWTSLYGGTLGTCTCTASGTFTGIKQ